MNREERAFALTLSGVHGVDHLLKRLFPPLVPVWVVAFGFPLWKLGLLLGIHSFGSAMGQAPMGVLSDRYDRRYLLPLGIGMVGLSIVVFATVPFLDLFAGAVTISGVDLSGQFGVMLVAMLAAGIGSSVVHPTGYPLISVNIRDAYTGRVLGFWGSASKFGDGLAPAFVGVLLVVTTWPWILISFGLLGVAYAGLLFLLLARYDTQPAATPDEGTDTEGDQSIWRWDRRLYIYPMILVFAYFSVQIMAANGVNAFLPEFITSVYGYSFSVFGFELTSVSTASFYFSALLIVAGITQLGTGRLVDRFDARMVLLAYLGVAVVALGVLGFVSLSPVGLFGVLVVLGASLWGLNPARDAIVEAIAPPERAGRTFGYIWTGALLASSVSPVIVGYLGDIVGLETAFLVLAVATGVSAVPVTLLLSDRLYVQQASQQDSPAD